MNHPDMDKAKVCYYYMPARNKRPAEIISVLNSTAWCIQVPVREEDIELYAFFHRDMTETEVSRFGKKQTWRIFTSWEEMVNDHVALKIEKEVLNKLDTLRPKFVLTEEVAA